MFEGNQRPTTSTSKNRPCTWALKWHLFECLQANRQREGYFTSLRPPQWIDTSLERVMNEFWKIRKSVPVPLVYMWKE